MLTPSLDTIRLFLHLLAASVWVGGQVAVAGIVPSARGVGTEATSAVARGFARVAWPAFVLAFVTGIWNLLAQERSVTSAYNATLGLKVLLFVVAGVAAFLHGRSSNRAIVGATGAIGGIFALVILFLGVLLTTG